MDAVGNGAVDGKLWNIVESGVVELKSRREPCEWELLPPSVSPKPNLSATEKAKPGEINVGAPRTLSRTIQSHERSLTTSCLPVSFRGSFCSTKPIRKYRYTNSA